ncbi:hypothetical protein E1A91_D10G258700v1 [Gossypium mustelinum]|uniref:PGG domain-containing protein n=1 Tax=Gossypium mustelinum TaxID=34275 RepID=A0A5D2TCI3_GOSMU|nr:hypothetical protein E1A91_D10G258700v1 [Gossypium mustelinum]
MDENLRKAARTGKVNELYRVIQRNGNVLRRVDEVEFMETPLHIAAEEGSIEFAMEMMNLKPSFARKLNHQGLSPLHIAVRKGHKEMALRLLEIDKHLVRVRGKKASPDCIQDVTIENRTALHIAIQNNRLDVLQLLIRTLKRKNYHWKVVNRKDKDGNTALHIATIHNQPKILDVLQLLIRTLKRKNYHWKVVNRKDKDGNTALHIATIHNQPKADKHATNQVGLTALGVAQQHNNKENIAMLQGCFIPVVSNFKRKLEKQIVKYMTKASLLIFQNMDDISADDRNVLLVILGLLLTATYQATLSPPGGVWQGENTSRSKGSFDEWVLGKSVMDESEFLLFYISTYLVFLVTLFLTLALLKTFPHEFRTALQVLLAFLAVSFDESIYFIAPTHLTYAILNIFSGILFLLMLSIVSIVGCWIFPSILNYLGNGISIGTILVVCYCLFASVDVFDNGINFMYFAAFIGCWLFLSLGRLCIMRCTQFCNTHL